MCEHITRHSSLDMASTVIPCYALAQMASWQDIIDCWEKVDITEAIICWWFTQTSLAVIGQLHDGLDNLVIGNFPSNCLDGYS